MKLKSEKMKDLLAGLIGLSASVIATPLFASGSESKIINAVVQVVIAVVTLVRVLKSRKE